MFPKGTVVLAMLNMFYFYLWFQMSIVLLKLYSSGFYFFDSDIWIKKGRIHKNQCHVVNFSFFFFLSFTHYAYVFMLCSKRTSKKINWSVFLMESWFVSVIIVVQALNLSFLSPYSLRLYAKVRKKETKKKNHKFCTTESLKRYV